MQLLMSRVVRRAQPTDESASGLLEEDHKRRKDSTIRGFRESFSAVVFGSWLNVLLLLAPLSLWGVHEKWGDGFVFVTSMLALVPLAERLSFVTEQVAAHTNPTVGGLLNATFGNVTELIVCVLALRDDMVRVVQLSLLGSVLSNLLLILGVSFFVGGLRYKQQRFREMSVHVNSALLMLATMALVFPEVLLLSGEDIDRSDDISSSRFVAAILLANYILFLVFQLRTHANEFESESLPAPALEGPAPTGTLSESASSRAEHEPGAVLGLRTALLWLSVTTVLISALSDCLVDAIEGAARQLDISSVFICAVLLPIVGNAAEHGAAIIFAWRNEMELVLGIALGSASQVALLVLPGMVLLEARSARGTHSRMLNLCARLSFASPPPSRSHRR